MEEQEYYKVFFDIFMSTLPCPQALAEATRRTQTLNDLKQAFIAMFPRCLEVMRDHFSEQIQNLDGKVVGFKRDLQAFKPLVYEFKTILQKCEVLGDATIYHQIEQLIYHLMDTGKQIILNDQSRSMSAIARVRGIYGLIIQMFAGIENEGVQELLKLAKEYRDKCIIELQGKH